MTTSESITAEHATAEHTIADARGRIDALDDSIISLIEERISVSEQIQATRIAAGGRRVHLAREMEVLRRYRDGLGAPGTGLAMTLLDLCRGRV
ncbi:Intracellular chorismate mutase [Streptomyces sp. MP131-18]|nr:Intracellular chorismate mutase [Streptomyces sp. MP131-18]